MTLKLCIAGVSGWTGSAIARTVLERDGLDLVGAVARSSAGQDVGDALGLGRKTGVTIRASVEEALADGPDVLIDYTSARVVKDHALTALARGIPVIVGTSGLTGADYGDLDAAARRHGVGIIGGGNFSLTAAMMQYLARIAARHLPHYEILDYSWADKEDVPSGTARELAETLASVRRPEYAKSPEDFIGPGAARGASIDGVQVHSLRLPGFVLRCEAVFGLSGERLTIAHEAGQSAQPYVDGTLLAAARVRGLTGLTRGLEDALFAGDADAS